MRGRLMDEPFAGTAAFSITFRSHHSRLQECTSTTLNTERSLRRCLGIMRLCSNICLQYSGVMVLTDLFLMSAFHIKRRITA